MTNQQQALIVAVVFVLCTDLLALGSILFGQQQRAYTSHHAELVRMVD